MVERRGSKRAAILDVAVALSAPASALVIAELIHSLFGLNRLGILFLAAVTVPASIRGTRAAIIAAITTVFCYRFFLDLRTGEETSPAEDVLNLVVFLVVALITGALAGRVRDQAAAAQRHATRMELLFKASRALADVDGETPNHPKRAAFWRTLADSLGEASRGAAFVLDRKGELQADDGGSAPPQAALETGRHLLNKSGQPVDRFEDWAAIPIRAEGSTAGVLIWEYHEADAGVRRFAELLSELASASLIRSAARSKQVEMRAAEEAGRLRQALLSSISHDFRSPLAAIIGSSTSLLEYGDKFDDEVRKDLLLNIQHEGERLNEFVVNLLNMTRLQSGVIQPNLAPVNLAHHVAAAAERIKRHTDSDLQLRISGVCEAEADPVLLEQALYNILDNARKYGSPADGIDVNLEEVDGYCEVTISDRGPGLPEDDLAGVFTPFHYARKTGHPKGTGLGLSISRGFVEAMGGSLKARNRGGASTGLEIVIKLPRSVECTV